MNVLTNLMFLTSDAGQDLVSDAWTEGNLFNISGLVDGLGGFACTVISVVGFCIVIFAILKNALSGLYVVNPAFWDKVSEIKTQAVDTVGSGINGAANLIGSKTGGAGSAAAQKLGGFLTFLLGCIPNVKALTDFEDGAEVDKKQYFMKSIPLLVVWIFIGMLIFFGYPAKIAKWIGNGGTYVINAILSNADPITFVQNLSDNVIIYSLATDGSNTTFDKNINGMTSDTMKVVSTKYKDANKEPMQNTATYIESKFMEVFQNCGELAEDDGYAVSYSTTFMTSIPKLSAAYTQTSEGYWIARATNGMISIKYWIAGSDLPTGSQLVGENDYFLLTVQLTPMALSNTSTESAAAYIHVKSASGTTSTVNGTTVTTFDLIMGVQINNPNTNTPSYIGKLGGNVTVYEYVAGADGSELVNTYTGVFTSKTTDGSQPILRLNGKVTLDLTGNKYYEFQPTSKWSLRLSDGSTKTVELSVNAFRINGTQEIGKPYAKLTSDDTAGDRAHCDELTYKKVVGK